MASSSPCLEGSAGKRRAWTSGAVATAANAPSPVCGTAWLLGRRLWCVFEVAAFCRRRGLHRIDFVPTHVPLLEFGIAVLYFSNNYVYWLVQAAPAPSSFLRLSLSV